MFLTISNLPPNIKVESLKKIIKEQCYVENMLVDNLKSHGKKGKCVTVGFMDKIEASVVLAKMDGYFMDGYKLEVRVVQQKTKQPESITSNPMVQPNPMPLKSSLPVHQFAPLFSAGAGLPSAPLFTSANAGLRPAAPMFPAPGLPPAPPLHLAVPSKQTPPETVAVAPNPVPLPPNPVVSLSKNVNKTPPVKFKLTPPAEKQSSTSSMPYYAIKKLASEDNLPTKNKLSEGSSREKTRRRRSRCKSRSPPRRSSSRKKSRSPPHRDRIILVDGLEVSHDRPSRYDRKHDRFVNRVDHGRFDRARFVHGRFDRDRFEHDRRSPDRQRGHFTDRGRYEDRKRQFDGQSYHRNHSYGTERFDKRKRTRSPKNDEEDFIDRKRDKRRSRPDSHERLDKRKITRSPKSKDDFIDRKHDMRHSRSNSNERLDKRKRYGSPTGDDVDLIYQNLDIRRSRSFSGDRKHSREGTESPVAVRAEENVAPVIPQAHFDPSNTNTESSVNTSFKSHSNTDPYSLSSPVPNPFVPVDGSVPSQTYYQSPGWYPPNPYTTNPTNQASTNAYPINTNFQVGVPFNPALQNPISPYPNNPFLQTTFVPPLQNVTRPNPNLQIHTNIRTRFNPPSQNRTLQKITTNINVPSSANTQSNSDPPPQRSTTLNDNVPSGMETQPRPVAPSQNSTTLNDNVASSAKTQPRSVAPPQTSTTLNDNVASSAKTQPRPVAPSQNSTTLNDNVASSAKTQPRSVAPPQTSTTLNDNVASSAKTQPRSAPPSQNSTTLNDNVASSAKTQPRSAPLSQNSTTLNDNVASSPKPQPRSVPSSQNSTTLNDNVPSSAKTQPRSVPPSQNSTTFKDNIPSSAKTQPRSAPPSQNSTTLNDNVPSSAKTQPRSAQPSQNSTTLNDNVASSPKTQPRSAPPSQNSTTLNDNVPSSAKVQPRSAQPSQNSTTLNDNVASSPKTQPRSVPPPQTFTTLNDNVPSSANIKQNSDQPSQNFTTVNDKVSSSANTQPSYVTQFKLNRKCVELKKTLSQTTSINIIRWALPNLVLKELFNLYSVDYLPNGVYNQIKAVYSNRVQEAIRPGLTGKETYEYYKSLYPYCNEKLVLEGLIGRKLMMLKEDKPDPEPVKPVQPYYKIKFNGVDRDIIYENALDEELKALEQSFLEACRPSNDPDTDKFCNLLKRKGVGDFFKWFRMQMLKLSYEKSVFLLKMNYNKSEPSLSSLTKFLESKNMKMINHSKHDKFILVRCENKEDFLKMQTCRLIYIDDCALTIRNYKSFDVKYNFEEIINNASSSIKIEKDDVSGELDDDETQVINMDTKLEPGTSKDKDFDNTVPKESDKVITQYFDMSSTFDVKCETSMEEYVDLSPSKQENTQHAMESKTGDNAECDILMEDCANLLPTALDNETAQRIGESHTSNVESDTLVANVVPTLADELKQDTKCVKDCTNEEQLVKESPAILEPKIRQCNVESNKDNNECYKPMKEQVDAIIDEAKLEDTKCIKDFNNAKNQCDTREEEHVNKLSADIKSEDMQCNEESNKNSYECGKPLKESINIFTKVEQAETLVGRPVNNLLDGIDEGNAQCIKKEQEFNNKCNTETNKPAEEPMNVPLAELESECNSHIEESNIKCDPDGLVNVRVTILETGNIQSIQEIQNDPIADEYVKDPFVIIVKESENTPCVKEKKNTLEERVDAHENLKPTKGIKESYKSLEELNNKQCVEYAQNKIYDTNLEELKDPTAKLKPDISESVDESINTQSDKCDKLKEEYVEISPVKLEPEITLSIESSNTQNDENCANIESDYTDDQIANTLAEIEECLQNSNFDFDNLDDFNEIGEYKEKPEIVNANENLTTKVEDEDLEDF